MNPNGILVIILALFFPATLSAQTAQAKGTPTLRSVVRQGSQTTYFDLMRMLLPDLQFDSVDSNSATAHQTISFRNIEDDEATELKGDFAVSDFVSRWIMSGGRQIALLQLDLSAEGANEGTPYEGEATLVAAFNVDAAPKLLDVMDIKTDRFTDFWEAQPMFQLNAQHGAFVVHSSHFNAGESYNDVRLVFLDGDRFKTITSVFLLNTQGCGATIEETPSFQATPDGRKYPKLTVRVKVKKEADGAECSRKTPGYRKFYQGVFYWNAAKGEYQGNSPQLNMLDKFNRARL
jgi:hypothetical protein